MLINTNIQCKQREWAEKKMSELSKQEEKKEKELLK